MPASLLADLIVVVHVAFVAFVVLGGLVVLRRPRVGWVHLPAVAWGAIVELAGWVCPLTPLEIELRRRAGAEGYRGDFVQHYLLPILYPDWLTRPTQIALGLLVIGINAAIYLLVLRRHARFRGRRAQGARRA